MSGSLTITGDGRAPRPISRTRGPFRDPRKAAMREAWERARIYEWFEGAPRCEVLGHTARLRPWRYQRSPIVFFG